MRSFDYWRSSEFSLMHDSILFTGQMLGRMSGGSAVHLGKLRP